MKLWRIVPKGEGYSRGNRPWFHIIVGALVIARMEVLLHMPIL